VARYMLDTNICIYLMKHQPEIVAQRFAQCRVGDVVMSAITHAELAYGVAVSADPAQTRAALADLVGDIPVLPFDAECGLAYGPIRQATRDNRKDALDKLIAAHAVAEDLTLVTNNTADFVRYPGLNVENWLEQGG
jgi:tRNA(fMet)-specific endonuclease VapC